MSDQIAFLMKQMRSTYGSGAESEDIMRRYNFIVSRRISDGCLVNSDAAEKK
ncbi:MAG TPA: hypothetical protein VGO84_13145 [Burkholderiales bacterium]|jgi:hypothetical protein|nr:hypothetical protein [Burkholderiales bacterium]